MIQNRAKLYHSSPVTTCPAGEAAGQRDEAEETTKRMIKTVSTPIKSYAFAGGAHVHEGSLDGKMFDESSPCAKELLVGALCF